MDLTCLLRNRAVALCSAALLLSIGSHARADAPALLPVHGFLTDAEGTPETGKHRLTFFLYEDETGGTPLYTDDYASIEVNAGQFIVYLGSGDDALDMTMFRDASALWLETVIDGGETITPRIRLASVAYAGFAQYCGEATALGSAAADALVTDASFKGSTSFEAATFSQEATFGDATIEGSATLEAATFNGRATFDDGIRFTSRVVKGAAMTGTAFAAATVGASNVCSAGFHPCTAWEVMVIDTISADVVFDTAGWVIGSFPNIDYHMRSLVNGQQSLVCPDGMYLAKLASNFSHGNINTPGGLHCMPQAESYPVWCCRNKG